ncbi:High affinity cAMP-specific 3',5'-cyclic phosphodiesterase 7A [Dinochytrium kinnereticum]|nr:High affinity cAMP-specific 3',5'-cyclic phosphodiesterase 7A [Dinochytrium kinnereticum]
MSFSGHHVDGLVLAVFDLLPLSARRLLLRGSNGEKLKGHPGEIGTLPLALMLGLMELALGSTLLLKASSDGTAETGCPEHMVVLPRHIFHLKSRYSVNVGRMIMETLMKIEVIEEMEQDKLNLVDREGSGHNPTKFGGRNAFSGMETYFHLLLAKCIDKLLLRERLQPINSADWSPLTRKAIRWKTRKRHAQKTIFDQLCSSLLTLLTFFTILHVPTPVSADPLPPLQRPLIKTLPQTTPTSHPVTPPDAPPYPSRHHRLNKRQLPPSSPTITRPTALPSGNPPSPSASGIPTIRFFFPIPVTDERVMDPLQSWMAYSAEMLQRGVLGGVNGTGPLLSGANVSIVTGLSTNGSDAVTQPFLAINNEYSVGILGDSESKSSLSVLLIANAFQIPLCDIDDYDDNLSDRAQYPYRFQVSTRAAFAVESMMRFIRQRGFTQLSVVVKKQFTAVPYINDVAKSQNITLFGPFSVAEGSMTQTHDCGGTLQSIRRTGATSIVFQGEFAELSACLEVASSLKMLYDDGYTWIASGIDVDLLMNPTFLKNQSYVSLFRGMFLMGSVDRQGVGYARVIEELGNPEARMRYPALANVTDPVPSLYLLYRSCLELFMIGFDTISRQNGPNTSEALLGLSQGIYGKTIDSVKVPDSFSFPDFPSASGNIVFQNGAVFRERNFTIYYCNGMNFTIIGNVTRNSTVWIDDAALRSLGWKNPNDVQAFATTSTNRSTTLAISAGVTGALVSLLIGLSIWLFERYCRGKGGVKSKSDLAKKETAKQSPNVVSMDGPGSKAISILRTLRDPSGLKKLKPADVDYLIDVFTSGNAYVPNLDDFENVGGTEIDDEMRAWVLGSVLAAPNAGVMSHYNPIGLVNGSTSVHPGGVRYMSTGLLPNQVGGGPVMHGIVRRTDTGISDASEAIPSVPVGRSDSSPSSCRPEWNDGEPVPALPNHRSSIIEATSGVGSVALPTSGGRRGSMSQKNNNRRLSVASASKFSSGSSMLSASVGPGGIRVGSSSILSEEGLQKMGSGTSGDLDRSNTNFGRRAEASYRMGGGYRFKSTPHLINPGPVDGIDLRAIMDYLDLWYLNWNIDMFEICEMTAGHPLYFTGMWLYEQNDLIQDFRIPKEKFQGWLLLMESEYRPHPYHNSIHAADVLHSFNYLLLQSQHEHKYTKIEKLSGIISAIGHDIDHPGYNNQFLVKSRHPMAMMYSDTSINEFHHSAHVFQLSTASCFNIFSDLANEEYEEARRIIIRLILATDMAKHFEYLTKFKTKISSNGFNRLETQENRFIVMEIAMKCADLNNPSKTPDLAGRWCESIMEEFYRQGDSEREIGLPVSQFMDRNNTNVAKCQIGFIDILVAPLFDAWTNFNQGDERCTKLQKAIVRNRSRWAGLSISQQLAQNLLGQISIDGPSTMSQHNAPMPHTVGNTQSANTSGSFIAQQQQQISMHTIKKASNSSMNVGGGVVGEDEGGGSKLLLPNPPALPVKVGYLETMPSVSGSALIFGEQPDASWDAKVSEMKTRN